MKILAIVVCALAVLVVLLYVMARSHRKWLDQQSPVGVWRTSVGEETITLQFEGGPHEGTYKQLAESAKKRTREFGCWEARQNELHMLIMATDIRNHPRFGQDTPYGILYVGADSIEINGPDRPALAYQRVTDGTLLSFDNDVE